MPAVTFEAELATKHLVKDHAQTGTDQVDVQRCAPVSTRGLAAFVAPLPKCRAMRGSSRLIEGGRAGTFQRLTCVGESMHDWSVDA
jgi:hypothetical protein